MKARYFEEKPLTTIEKKKKKERERERERERGYMEEWKEPLERVRGKLKKQK